MKLRLNGYSVNGAGHIDCYREGARFEQERTAVIRIDIERGDGGRELVNSLIAAADTPRALHGRAKNGSAVLLFRCDNANSGVFHLALRSGERITVTVGSEGQTLDPDAYFWKGRGPEEITRDSLPILTADVGEAIVNAAFALGASWVEIVEQEERDAARSAQINADFTSGKLRIPTEEDRQAALDAEIVEANKHRDLAESDVSARSIMAARHRHAARLAKRQAEADEKRQAIDDARIVKENEGRDVEVGVLGSKAIIDARERHAKRQRETAAA